MKTLRLLALALPLASTNSFADSEIPSYTMEGKTIQCLDLLKNLLPGKTLLPLCSILITDKNVLCNSSDGKRSVLFSEDELNKMGFFISNVQIGAGVNDTIELNKRYSHVLIRQIDAGSNPFNETSIVAISGMEIYKLVREESNRRLSTQVKEGGQLLENPDNPAPKK